MAHDVFVSYSSRDQGTALALVNGLESAGVRCWIAPRDIKAGDVWAQAIVTAITAARVMVVVFSSHANRSGHVVNEVDAAIRKGASVIPFRIENVMPEGAMEYHLRTRHWLDALTPDQNRHVADLVATVQALLGKEAAPLPETEFGRVVARAQAPPSKPRPVIHATDSGFHVKLPKPAGLSRKIVAAGGIVAAIVVVAVAVPRLMGGSSDRTGVEFEVRETTAGSEFRTTIRSKSIRFFESGRGVPAFANRTYGNRFAVAQTRYVNTEVIIGLDAPGRVLSVPLSCTIYHESDTVTGTFTLENRISATGTEWQSASGWGAERPGSWKPGKYRVDCRYGEKVIARGSFEMLA
jgi:hypothetical protein